MEELAVPQCLCVLSPPSSAPYKLGENISASLHGGHHRKTVVFPQGLEAFIDSVHF
jgi:hypothetical protein